MGTYERCDHAKLWKKYITKDVEKQDLLLRALGTDWRVGEDTESKSASP